MSTQWITRSQTARAPSARVRALLIALALAVAACTQPPPSRTPTPTPTRDPATIAVTALLDLSGPRLPSGAPQRDALQLWLDQHQTQTPRVRLKFVDLAGSPSRLILELRRAVTDDRADAVIVGAPVMFDETLAAAVELAKVPVLFTLPIADPGGGWGFALAPTPAQLAKAALDDAAGRAPLAGSAVVSDESSGAITDRAALVADLASRGLTASVAKATPGDATKTAATIAASRVAFFAGPARPYLDAIRSATTSSTYLYLSYVCDLGDVGSLRDKTALATWPGSRWIARARDTSTARLAFIQSFTDRFGPPSTAAATAYDALTLIWTGAEDGAEAVKIRDRLQSRSTSGVATTYLFSAARHAGFTLSDLAFLRYASPGTSPAIREVVPTSAPR